MESLSSSPKSPVFPFRQVVGGKGPTFPLLQVTEGRVGTGPVGALVSTPFTLKLWNGPSSPLPLPSPPSTWHLLRPVPTPRADPRHGRVNPRCDPSLVYLGDLKGPLRGGEIQTKQPFGLGSPGSPLLCLGQVFYLHSTG